jgi:hypothetical protein
VGFVEGAVAGWYSAADEMERLNEEEMELLDVEEKEDGERP